MRCVTIEILFILAAGYECFSPYDKKEISQYRDEQTAAMKSKKLNCTEFSVALNAAKADGKIINKEYDKRIVASDNCWQDSVLR